MHKLIQRNHTKNNQVGVQEVVGILISVALIRSSIFTGLSIVDNQIVRAVSFVLCSFIYMPRVW